MDWKNKITHVLDCGCSSATIYDVKKDETEKINHADVLNLPSWLPEGSVLVVENAHMGVEKTDRSKAQVFTREQLIEFYTAVELNGLELWLFPQQSTPRACAYAGVGKDDWTDPKSIYNLLSDFPNTSMRKPSKVFDPSPRLIEQWEFKAWTNVFCDHARSGASAYENDATCEWIVDNLDSLCERMSHGCKEFFGFIKEEEKTINGVKQKTGAWIENRFTSKKHEKFGKLKWNTGGGLSTNAIYSVACTLITPKDHTFETKLETRTVKYKYEAGQPRVRPYTGELAGWDYMKSGVFCMSPFHRRGGTARSNLYYHTMRKFVKNRIVNVDGITGFDYTKCRGGYFETSKELKKERLIKPNSRFSPEEDKLFRKYRKEGTGYIKELWSLIKQDMQSCQVVSSRNESALIV